MPAVAAKIDVFPIQRLFAVGAQGEGCFQLTEVDDFIYRPCMSVLQLCFSLHGLFLLRSGRLSYSVSSHLLHFFASQINYTIYVRFFNDVYDMFEEYL